MTVFSLHHSDAAAAAAAVAAADPRPVKEEKELQKKNKLSPESEENLSLDEGSASKHRTESQKRGEGGVGGITERGGGEGVGGEQGEEEVIGGYRLKHLRENEGSSRRWQWYHCVCVFFIRAKS